MGKVCCIPCCRSKSGNRRQPKLTFHEIPCDMKRRLKWLLSIKKIDPTADLTVIPQQFATVCSLHFTADQFKCGLKNTFLKRDAFPVVVHKHPVYYQEDLKMKHDKVLRHKYEQKENEKQSKKRPLILRYTKSSSDNYLQELPINKTNILLDVDSRCAFTDVSMEQNYPEQCDIEIRVFENNSTVEVEASDFV